LLDLLRLTPSFPLRADVRALAGDASDQLLHARLLALASWSEEHLHTPLAELLSGETQANSD
jgi:hypothetical protein